MLVVFPNPSLGVFAQFPHSHRRTRSHIATDPFCFFSCFILLVNVRQLNVTVPAFVPSLVTGITSTITSLKTPAKNRNQLFDFGVAGPLTGMLASLGVLYVGLQLTVQSDPQAAALFPALPLEILRQSSLGGGVIESVLGQGTLTIPGGAAGSQAVSTINIALHPVAVAGYMSIFVNALSALPIGSKCTVTVFMNRKKTMKKNDKWLILGRLERILHSLIHSLTKRIILFVFVRLDNSQQEPMEVG